MTNHPSASDPDRTPYVPAWSDSTPPHGSAAGPTPADPPPPAERNRHRGEPERSVLLSPVVLGLTALLLAVLGVGAFLYLDGEDERTLVEGVCLNDLSGNKPNIAECDTSEAKYQIMEIFTDTLDYGQCNSVAGANIPLLIDNAGRKDLLCAMQIA
ncbi:MAG TPA: hypothetical protein VLH10_20070 [Yinghuangia sp.]|nr:hypothetical protein [Yinghuangia sp.]